MNAHKVNVYIQQPPRPSHSHSHESQVFSHFCGRRQLHPSTTHDWLISPNVMFLRFIHSVLLFHCYIIFQCMNLSKTCTDWFIHLTVGEHFPVSSFEVFGIFLWMLFGAHVGIFLCGGFLEMELLSLKEYVFLFNLVFNIFGCKCITTCTVNWAQSWAPWRAIIVQNISDACWYLIFISLDY